MKKTGLYFVKLSLLATILTGPTTLLAQNKQIETATCRNYACFVGVYAFNGNNCEPIHTDVTVYACSSQEAEDSVRPPAPARCGTGIVSCI